MVSELVKESLRISIGRSVLIFLENNFRFEGVILGCDEEFLKIRDLRKGCEKLIQLNKISEAEIR